MTLKRIKDPLYGYITISSDIVNSIIDSASFQRLRRITQTSYAPLYSSAVHNRFVHSLGVYNLGKIACKSLRNEIEIKISNKELCINEDVDNFLDGVERVFLIACLLHDVGHAPFSHTGEEFYLESNGSYNSIHLLLEKTVNNQSFSNDIPKEKSDSAAPHEIMSAIVGLKEYPTTFSSSEDAGLFARCITGYKYSEPSVENSIKNCFIQLLNSKVIDVDKLDYLIRDAYITGYNTVKLDYERLLSAITIVCEDGLNCELAYHKSAISVIENVVYAHDSERKWIQSHPIILYESYILQSVMNMLAKELDTEENKLFSLDALSEKGSILKNGELVRLLSDDDIIVLMKKNYDKSSLIHEYFDRNSRRRPLWKSEAEYKAYFLDVVAKGGLLDAIEKAMKATSEYLSKNTENWVIDNKLVDTIREEICQLSSHDFDPATKKAQKEQKESILKVIDCLMDYAKEIGYKGDFVLIKASQFNSGFLKPDFSGTKIVFQNSNTTKIVPFGEKVSSLSGITRERADYFYLFYDTKNIGEKAFSIDALSRSLIRTFV